jgi:N-acetylneuraminic acid mutarotase
MLPCRLHGWIVLLSAALGAADRWVDLAPLPTLRQEVGVAALDGLVYVIGGITADRAASAVVERFDPRTERWERVADLPEALHHPGVAALDGRVFVLGGLDGAFTGVASAYAFDPITGQWQPMAPLPARRGAPGVAALGGKIYVAGGQGRTGAGSDFAAYTPDGAGGSWETLPALPTPRNHLAAAAVNGRFYAISGRQAGLRAEVEEYDPAARSWRARAPIPTARGGIAAAAIGTSIFVFGGEGNGALPSGVFPQTERYDVLANAWEARTDMSVPRHGIGAAVIGDTIFIPGGAEVEGFGVTAASTAYLPDAVDLPPFRRGDVQPDGEVDIADVVRIILHLFAGGPAIACLDAADADDSGELALTDAVFLLDHLFRGGPPLPAPASSAAGDPTPDLLPCG